MKLHIASGGETLSKIARLYRVDLTTLCRANPQLGPADALAPGTKVRVPVPRAAPVRRRIPRAAEPERAGAEGPGIDGNPADDGKPTAQAADGSFPDSSARDREASVLSSAPPAADAAPSSAAHTESHAFAGSYGHPDGLSAYVPPVAAPPAFPPSMAGPYGWYGWPWPAVPGWGGYSGPVLSPAQFPPPPHPLLYPSTLYHVPTLWETYAEESDDS